MWPGFDLMGFLFDKIEHKDQIIDWTQTGSAAKESMYL